MNEYETREFWGLKHEKPFTAWYLIDGKRLLTKPEYDILLKNDIPNDICTVAQVNDFLLKQK